MCVCVGVSPCTDISTVYVTDCVCMCIPTTLPLLSPPRCFTQKKDLRMLRFIQEVNTTTRSCALWDLDEDTEYIVHVQSISMSGTSPPSDTVVFRTPKESERLASKSPGEPRQRWCHFNVYLHGQSTWKVRLSVSLEVLRCLDTHWGQLCVGLMSVWSKVKNTSDNNRNNGNDIIHYITFFFI